MSIFGKSLKELTRERNKLVSEREAHADRLAMQMAPVEAYTKELTPIGLKICELDHKIRMKTPYSELIRRRDELRHAISRSPAGIERTFLDSELLSLEALLSNPRTAPISWKHAAIFFAVVAAMVVLPELIVDWLAP